MLVGNKEGRKKLEECIVNKKPVLVYGPPGIGKTASVYEIANRLGYKVYEYNASDDRKKEFLEYILPNVRTKSFVRVVYLFDEADSMIDSSLLAKLIRESIHPLVFTANEYAKVPKSIKDFCVRIAFRPPSPYEILTVLGDKKKVVVSSDVRNSIIATEYGTEKYRTYEISEEIEKFFKGQDFDFSVFDYRELLVWLIDNAHRFLRGKKLIDFFEVLSAYDLTKREEVLRLIESGRGRVEKPYFFKRVVEQRNSG